MDVFDFKWRIASKSVNPNINGYTDVIYFVSYDCWASLSRIEGDIETNYYSSYENSQEIYFTDSYSFIPLISVTDDDIFQWLTNYGLNQQSIEDDLRQQLLNQAN